MILMEALGGGGDNSDNRNNKELDNDQNGDVLILFVGQNTTSTPHF